MHIIALSADDALRSGLELIQSHGIRTPSRNGDVLRVPSPVITEYVAPRHYILTNAARNANPFFHFMESLWMLAGRNDLKFITLFNKRMASFSDDGVTQPAAYGHRWRNHFFGVDQISFVIDELHARPDSRRAVITMADPFYDVRAVEEGGKDVPCNTGIYFLLRDGLLNMTVVNRSNDAIWGAYGANVVHMSVLQEYIAAWLGVRVGKYYQFSNDLHLYVELFGEEEVKAIIDEPLPAPEESMLAPPLIAKGEVMEQFDLDLRDFFETFDRGQTIMFRGVARTSYFRSVAIPMFNTWRAYKEGERRAAKDFSGDILNAGWRRACVQWLNHAWQKKDAQK